MKLGLVSESEKNHFLLHWNKSISFLAAVLTFSKITLSSVVYLKRSGGGEGGMDWEFGIRRCKLLYIEWISNKKLYSISCNKHKGKEYEKEYI